MNVQSLEQLYSSKSDDELLLLSADKASLREEAKQVLIDELRRRGLEPPTNFETAEIISSPNRACVHSSLKFIAVLTFNIFVAVLGSAALEGEIGSVVHPRSIGGLLWKWWSLEILCAALLGFFVWKKWQAHASKWTWTIPAAWFGLGFALALTSREQGSVLTGGHGIWYQFSGADCQSGYRIGSGCVKFWAFTAPCVRGLSYAIGAHLSSKITSKPRHEKRVTPASSQTA